MSSLESFIGKYSSSFTKMQKLVAWTVSHFDPPTKKKTCGVGQQLHIQTKLSFKWSKIITFNTNILIYCEK